VKVIGKCSLCGANVIDVYPTPVCTSCGAVKRVPVIEMEPPAKQEGRQEQPVDPYRVTNGSGTACPAPLSLTSDIFQNPSP
jgi:hypothetical protein